ncbi:MAG: hypothetical protein JWP91_4001 [Fibrobacteres bacterium]|nr:hypothetical protein [Fibrobacterota bacterium]
MNDLKNTIAAPQGSKPSLDPLKLPRDAWRPSESSSQRIAPRTMEREIERIPVWIRSARHPEWVRVRLWDYSIHGFGILYQAHSGSSDFSAEGEAIELKMQWFGAGSGTVPGSYLLPCRIENSTRVEKGLRIGLSRLDLVPPRDGDDPPVPADCLLDDIRPLSVKILNPFLYKEWAEAKLIGIGPKASFVFESYDPSLLLFDGAALTVDIEVPLDTRGICSGTIDWIQAGREGRIIFAIRDTDITFDLSNAIGEHFVQAEICKPSRLAEFGLRLKRFKDQFRFRFITTQEEYEAILNLRRVAYVNAGKAAPDAPPDPVAMDFDSRSRLLTAFHGDILVASVALSFGGVQGAPLRAQICFPDSTFPVPVPDKHTVVEVHSLCTDFDYRGGDLIQAMFEHIGRSVLFSDRKWLLTFTTSKLWPLYRRIGFRKIGASVHMKDMGGLEHHLILMDRNTLVSGLGMTPFAWNYFFGSMVRDLLEKGQLRLGSARKARVALYSLFAGITRKWMQARMEKDFRVLLQRTGSNGGITGVGRKDGEK